MPGTIQVNVAGHACTTATVAAGGAGTIDVTVVGQTSPSATIVAGGVAVVTVPAGARGPEGPAGPQGPAGPPGTTTWAGITGKPSTFPPSSHAASHGQGGSDAITVAASQISGGSLPQNAVLDFNDGTSASGIGGWGFGVETGGGSEYATVTATGIVIHGQTSSTTINPAGITFADGSQQTIAWTGSYSHTHDDRYYTESEVDTLLAGKATPGDVTAAVAAVVGAAPSSLDTLQELAAALSNDASFATTVTNSLAAKAPIASPTFTGTVSGITATMVGLGNVPNVDATSRANHTGSQAISTVTGLQTALDGKQAAGSYAAAVHGHSISDVSGLQTALDGKQASGSYAAATHTHAAGDVTSGQFDIARIPTGSTSSTVCIGNDARLSDSRSPTSHSHGNITNAGAIGSTSGQIVVTTTSGVLTTAATISAATQVSGLAASATTDTTSASNISSGSLNKARLPVVMEQTQAIGSSGTSKTFDLSTGSVQTMTLTANCTVTMPTATAGASITLILTQGSSVYTCAFTGVKWPSGTAPTITATANAIDVLVFVSDGTNWYGVASQKFS